MVGILARSPIKNLIKEHGLTNCANKVTGLGFTGTVLTFPSRSFDFINGFRLYESELTFGGDCYRHH